MASGTSDLIVRLSLDTTQFEGSLSKFEGQMTKLQASCTNAATGITTFTSFDDWEAEACLENQHLNCGSGFLYNTYGISPHDWFVHPARCIPIMSEIPFLSSLFLFLYSVTPQTFALIQDFFLCHEKNSFLLVLPQLRPSKYKGILV